VRKAVAAALTRIEARDPAFARLLRNTIRTGARCRYDPDPARPVSWILRTLSHFVLITARSTLAPAPALGPGADPI